MLNQQFTKVACKKCGEELLSSDKYCYSCGEEKVDTIGLFEISESFIPENLKPGDIIRVDENNEIQKVTSRDVLPEDTVEQLDTNELELLYTKRIKQGNVYHRFAKVLLLNQIKEYSVFKKMPSSFYYTYNITSLDSLKSEIIEENLIKPKKIIDLLNDKNIYQLRFLLEKNGLSHGDNQKSDLIKRIVNNLADKEILSVFGEEYILSSNGQKFFDSNQHALFYDAVLKDSMINNIMDYDGLYLSKCKDFTKEEVALMLLDINREKFNKKGDLISYVSSFDLEEHIYNLMHDNKNRVIALLKKFIYNMNLSYYTLYNIDRLDPKFIKYLNYVLKIVSLDFNSLKEYFHLADEKLTIDIRIVPLDVTFKYLIRCFNNEDLEVLNRELNQYYNGSAYNK